MDWRVLIFTVLVLFLPLQDVQTRGVERGSTQERLLKQLRNYEIVTPYRLDGRHRREANTLSQDSHLIEASFLLPAFGKEYVLDVRLNENLFPGRYVETEYTEDGELITRLPHRNHHCYYQGVVRQGNVSAVAISTCKGLRGMINVDGEALRVEPLEGSSGQHHVVYKEEDVISDGQKLLLDVKYGTSESVEKLEELAAKPRHRRDILTETKYIEMVIVNDDLELQFRNNDINAVQQRSKDLANAMDMMYRQLNIRIALVAVEVWRSRQIVITSDAQANLVKFQDWRRTDLIHRIPNDNAQLISGQPFRDSIVGMAEHGKMCTEDKSCGVSTDLELPLARQAVIITHEIGHNLGFFHNTPACTCPDTSCIMDESLAEPPSTMFSSCTRDTLEDVLMKGYGVCLLDHPKSFFGGPVCGNHFLEEGEECDCGTPEECDTKCCIAETCRFHTNATCAAGQCCDENCQMKSRGALCRDTFNECDLPEYCTGMSAECPGNVYLQNGEKCLGDAYARCYNGKCLSYQRQCEDVWGKRTSVRVGVDECFDLNRQGSHFGSCGETDEDPCPIPKQDPNGPCYKACLPQNVKCGRLMCEYVPSRPVLSGIARIATGEATDAWGRRHDCKSASFDFGEDVPDPGYVAEGTLCAEGKICVDFKCQNMSAAGVRSCPYNCHNHGVCNSKNHCHCDQGWAPPLCNTVGYGGSIDSGPASPPDPSVPITTVTTRGISHLVSTVPVSMVPTEESDSKTENQPGGLPSGVSNGALAGILIFFLLVLPLIAIGVILYCKRQKLLLMFQKSKEPNSGSRHGSYVNKRYVGSNGTSSKNIVRTPSIRASPPTIEHIPNTGTGSVVHDIHPLVPTNPDVKYKPVPTQQPLKPSAPPPSRPTGPPSRPKGAVSRPSAPPTDPAVKALLPKSKPTTRSHSFNLPATIENQSGKAPLRPAPPLKRPPSVHETKTPENGIAGARAALKPVPRSRPNFNANNSKDNDWRKGGDRITKDEGMDEEVEEKPFIANKLSVPKKPSTPRKPPMLPSRPPLRTQSLRGPSVVQ